MCNSGVGKATAGRLAAVGHNIVIACRTSPKAELAVAEMTGDVAVAYLDLADLAGARQFADSAESVDVLVNNAGVLGLPLTRTAEGFEAHIGTNYLGAGQHRRGNEDLPSGSYLAPRFSQWRKPKVTKVRKKVRDAVVARRPWELSAELTGCNWQAKV